MSDCTSPGSGVLCILISDPTSKSALLLFTLLSESKPHPKNFPVIGNLITCSWIIINGGLLVILQSISWGWVINIDFLTIIVKLNNENFILCYCILNYDDNYTFDIYVSSSLLFSHISNQQSVVISVTIISKQPKNDINPHFKFRSTEVLESHDSCYI